jgi:signal transduction histidine kinase/CheY-like chemotaxis protein
MSEFRKLREKIEDAFSPSSGDGGARGGSPLAPPQEPASCLEKLLFGVLLIAPASLILAGAGLGFMSPERAAAVILLSGASLFALNLHQAARSEAKRRKDAAAPNPALQRAEQQSAMKSQLLATVSHDIRTPLSGIAGMSQLLSQTRLTPEQTNYLTGIRQSADALSRLVDDLLDYSSIEAGRFQLHPQQTDPRQLIESVIEMLAHRAHEKDIEVASWFCADVPGSLYLDPARLRQVLYNIVGNAVKFTTTGGVLVGTRMENDVLVISIRDSGPGTAIEDQTRIFSEYEQAGSTRDKAAGTGLGLAISQRIVMQAGGALTVESEKDVGSIFTIRLPVERAHDLDVPNRRISALGQNHVLVVAPQGVAREALAKTIVTLGGRCELATTVEEAENMLSSADERCRGITDIIVDHRLSDALSARLKTGQPDHSHIRSIFLVSPEARAEQQFASGYNSWLIRPLRERSLIGVLQGQMAGIELRDPLNDSQTNSRSRWTQAGAHSVNVLLGEDDPVNRLLMRTVLQKAGHTVAETEDFYALIAAATALPARPDVIVTDLSMPGGTGFDTLAAIRNFERMNQLDEVPIIVVTGSKGAAIRQQAIDAGATTVLTKPADPRQLSMLIASFALSEAS